MIHAGTSPTTPKSQYVRGGTDNPDLSSDLTADSVEITPSNAAPEERITEGGREARESCPVGEGIRAKKARSQAGNNAASPKNQ